MSRPHPLLDRLLRKVKASGDVPPSPQAWQDLLSLVARTYHDADQDRYTLERSIDISSREMQGLYQELKRETLRLADVANRTSNAVVITDRHGRIEWVNEAFSPLTGYPLDEVKGRSPGSFLQGPNTDMTARKRMRDAIAEARSFDEEVWNYTRAGDQYFVRISTRVNLDDRADASGFVAVQVDVTEQHIAHRREALAQKVAAALLDARSLSTAADGLLAALVSELDFPAANLWVVDPGRPTLRYLAGAGGAGVAGGAGGAAANDHGSAAVDGFLRASRELAFARGDAATPDVDLPGLVWGSGQMARLGTLSDSAASSWSSRRREAAQAAGIDLLCAAPILGPEGVLGVIEVASSRGHPINVQLGSILEHIARQLAAFVLQDRSRRAFRSMFDRSPDALVLVDASGEVRAANTRAAELFGPSVGAAVGALLEAGDSLVAAALGDAPTASMALQHRSAHGRDGKPFSAEVSASVSDDSGAPNVILSVRDLTMRHRMEAELTQSLHEKETLLKEIHHRVKNNLQIISSLLMLQVDQMPSPEAKALLVESAARVRSMALVHQHLYGVDSIAHIDLARYVSELAESLRSGLAARCVMFIDATPIELTVEHAVPLGLVLNKLLTNALKYGASADGSHVVRVSLQRTDGLLTVRVADQGRGLPEDFEPGRGGSLGLKLVRSLTRQLRGTLTFRTEGGAVFELVCPLPG